MTEHTIRITILRDDRDEPIAAGIATFRGEDYDTFDGAQARARLIAGGRLVLGTELITFDEYIVPTAKVDRIAVEVANKSRTGGE